MSRAERRWTAAGLLLVLLATAVAYARVATFDFVDYDDPAYVVDNEFVRQGLSSRSLAWAFRTTHASNWHPLTWLAHMLDVELFGLAAGAHHLSSLAWHLLNVVLVTVLLVSATRDALASLLVAALFALHPLNVESVAWISERKNLISTTCALLSLWAWVRYGRHGARRDYALAGAALALGLLAKPMLVTLPFLYVLLDVWPLGRLRRGSVTLAPLLLEKLPLCALAAGSAAVTLFVQRAAMGTTEVLPLGVRVANAIAAYVTYLRKLVWPIDLAILYQHPYALGGSPPPTWRIAAMALLLVALSVGAVAARRRGWPLVGWLWFVGTLVPVIGIVQVGEQALADRYGYLPCIGLFVVLAFAASELVRKYPAARAPTAAAAVLGLAALAALTWGQTAHWRDSLALFGRGIEISPSSPALHYNLGTALEDRQPEQAAHHYRQALRTRPHDAAAHFGLANALAASGAHEAAIAEYERTLDLAPDRVDALFNLANTLQAQGRVAQAIERYRQALALEPGSAKAHHNLALAHLRSGHVREALEGFERAAELEPQWVEPLVGRAWILAASSDPELRNPAEAIRLGERALELSRERDAALLDTLAIAYAAGGEYDRAERAANEALRLARAAGDNRRAAAIEVRILRYREQQPWVFSLGHEEDGS